MLIQCMFFVCSMTKNKPHFDNNEIVNALLICTTELHKAMITPLIQSKTNAPLIQRTYSQTH